MMRIPHYRTVVPILAFCLYLAGSTPYLGHWDSFDYLKQIVTHQLSALGIGRPVYIGYNILLWESVRRILSLEPLQAEIVVMTATVLFGVLGILLFQRLSVQLLPSSAGLMAAVSLMLSPVYALYSGLIMTEVPMIAVILAAAVILWKSAGRFPALRDIAGGLLFGLAVGIREQALTLGAAFFWILYSRRRTSSSRLRSMIFFGVTATTVILIPAVAFYLSDPNGFLERIKTWVDAIPMGHIEFWNNVSASLLYTFAICPASWIAVSGAGVHRLIKKQAPDPVEPENTNEQSESTESILNPILGIVCCLILPVAFLWRDADVQDQPRYLLIALPASLILCTSLYRRWIPSRKGLTTWMTLHVIFFGLALATFWPIRQTQIKKMEFARVIRDSIPETALIIAGNYSPVLDYYRGIGMRPGWRILWSGWNWNAQSVDEIIRDAWADHIPVYVSTDFRGWFHLETEFLDLYFLMKGCKKEIIAPNLFRVYPNH
jgi:hypothetical protein